MNKTQRRKVLRGAPAMSLIVGVVISCGVALVCAAVESPRYEWLQTRSMLGRIETHRVLRTTWSSGRPDPLIFGSASGLGVRTSMTDVPTPITQVPLDPTTTLNGWPSWRRTFTVRAGWPVPCLWGERVQEGLSARTVLLRKPPTPALTSYSMAVSVPGSAEGAIPLMPLLPGLVVNTLFYGTGALLVVLVLRGGRALARRRLRRTRSTATVTASAVPADTMPPVERGIA